MSQNRRSSEKYENDNDAVFRLPVQVNGKNFQKFNCLILKLRDVEIRNPQLYLISSGVF